MIRFKPDTWWEALMRPFAMAAPDANVYVEIAAPDLRFAVALVAAVALLAFHRRAGRPRVATLALLALVAVAFIPWLETSGNGRYFVPMLLLAGPLVAGLIFLLPFTAAFRLFLAGGMLIAQMTVIALNSPWAAWAWAPWKEAPYFQVDAPPRQGADRTTYFTLSSISYSLIIPQLAPQGRWISLASGGATPRDAAWVKEFIAGAQRRVLVVPSLKMQTPQGQPTQQVRESLDALLGPHALALERVDCQVLHSRGLAAIGLKSVAKATESELRQFSFWLCPLRYPVEWKPSLETQVALRVEQVFDRMEQMCPRFFRPREATTTRINGGAVRQYPGSDMRVYVMDEGYVLYKFWRALNPVHVGSMDDVLAGRATVDCNRIRGRAGLPWEREI